ncbi:hypothetical protein GALMADRAFT_133956 [Galerina marginata CBS 339.88]|uniref:FAS1 domain-containing protein n=1 Tax=Galerina marginata (strain CBS 339.88) TaxID=685588 RepID=A0A067TTK1_GALM3|nr:hypothetical protein GALMADRAFT_133956 [Galerina marginata CBS 339.88]
MFNIQHSNFAAFPHLLFLWAFGTLLCRHRSLSPGGHLQCPALTPPPSSPAQRPVDHDDCRHGPHPRRPTPCLSPQSTPPLSSSSLRLLDDDIVVQVTVSTCGVSLDNGIVHVMRTTHFSRSFSSVPSKTGTTSTREATTAAHKLPHARNCLSDHSYSVDASRCQ